MRFLKLGLISLLVFSVVIYLLSLLIPSHVRISRAINIHADSDRIANHLMDVRQWKSWNLLVNDTGNTNQVYDTKAFRSDQLQVELREVKTDTVLAVWRHQNGRELTGGFSLHTSGDETVVQWYFDFYLKWYPWEKFGSIVYDKQLGPSLEQSLAALKKQVEATP